ncbi:hypothetical protein ACUJ46_01605 [Sandaracinobacteroides sp. A072]|uniref:hypothetical protein n=1 Tax=Sandaracinobacteroides sp. A072 TaxID=3461146 RepID=UPI004040FC18
MTGHAVAMVAAALLLAAPAGASGRAPFGEIWAYPALFGQALEPLAPLAGRVARDNLCPDLAPGEDQLLHTYAFEARFAARGASNRRWDVTDLRLLNPSGCDSLDAEVTRLLRPAVASFAEPREDMDGNGWYRLPRIQLKVTD